MTTKTLTLAEFLLERLAEDEVAFTRIAPAQEDRWFDREGNKAAVQINASLRRWAAECEAKRRIVTRLAELEPTPGTNPKDWYGVEWCALDYCARALAAVYADHPDYRDDWRP